MRKIPFNLDNASLHVPLMRRADLAISPQSYRGEPYWVVKEPLDLKYHHLNSQEFAVLQWLAEPLSLLDLKEKFERRFAPDRVTTRELQDFIISLYKKSLLVSRGPEQGRHLLDIKKETKRKEALNQLKNIYAIKWKGFDPEWILNRLNPWVSWFFSAPMVLCNGVIIAIAILWAAANYQEIQERMPTFQSFFAPENWVRLFLLSSFLKVIHEFGHGLSFKRFGGECHEIGVMILFFTPTLYCNTSDSWMLPNKYHRAAVGLAGIYVELCTLAVATAVWWFTKNETFQLIALQVMFICSVSTTLFNGNPLVKYDGYFVLSDLWEVPNLSNQANGVVQKLFLKYCCGMEREQVNWAVHDVYILLAIYAIAAFCYRIFITVSICLFLGTMLGGYGLSSVALVMALISVVGLVGGPVFSVGKKLFAPGASLQMKPRNLTITLAIVFGVLLAVLLTPLPASVNCDFAVRMKDAATVYVPEDAELVEMKVQLGDPIEAGETIAVFRSHELEIQAIEKQSALELATLELNTAAKLRKGSTSEIAKLRQRVFRLQDELAEIEHRLKNLTVVSSESGMVCRPSSVAESNEDQDQLPQWDQLVLISRNLNAFVKRGTPLVIVGNPEQLQAVLKIPQRDIQLVRSDLRVKLLANGKTLQRFGGTVSTISVSDTSLSDLPEGLAQQERIRISSSAGAGQQGSSVADTQQGDPDYLESQFYQAIVQLDGYPDGLIAGAQGTAKVSIGYRNCLWHLRRWLDANWRIYF